MVPRTGVARVGCGPTRRVDAESPMAKVIGSAVRSGPWMPRLARRPCRVAVPCSATHKGRERRRRPPPCGHPPPSRCGTPPRVSPWRARGMPLQYLRCFSLEVPTDPPSFRARATIRVCPHRPTLLRARRNTAAGAPARRAGLFSSSRKRLQPPAGPPAASDSDPSRAGSPT